MKGITPVISTIILLLITIAIAGAAWAYIQGFVQTQISRSPGLTCDETCPQGAPCYSIIKKSPGNNEDMIVISNSDSVEIEKLSLEGPGGQTDGVNQNCDYTLKHSVDGITLYGVSNFVITNVSTSKVASGIVVMNSSSRASNFGIIQNTEHSDNLGQGININRAGNVKIINNYVHDIGNQNYQNATLLHGIYVGHHASNIVVSNNRLSNNTGFGIHAYTSDGVDENNIVISNNIVASNGLANVTGRTQCPPSSTLRGGIFSNAKNTVIKNNNLSDNIAYGIAIGTPFGPATVENNKVNQSYGNNIYFEVVANRSPVEFSINILNNTVTDKLNTTGVRLAINNETPYVNIRNNSITSTQDGIYITTSASPPAPPTSTNCGATITTSTVLTTDTLDCGQSRGILINAPNVVLDCAGHKIDGIKSPGSNGIYIASGYTNITVKNCILTDWDRGIYHYGGSSHKLINNTILNNTNGIYLSASSLNIITNNTACSNSPYDIYVTGGSGNSGTGNICDRASGFSCASPCSTPTTPALNIYSRIAVIGNSFSGNTRDITGNTSQFSTTASTAASATEAVPQGPDTFKGFRRCVSVKDYGAEGDGSKDDTTAIQTAMDYASSIGGYVFFPSGTYVISHTLNISADNVRLRGVGTK